MQVSNNYYVSNYANQNQSQPNFKGTYIIQIPHKAFSNPENIKECSKLVGEQISKFMHPNKFMQKINNFMNLFRQNLFCYPEKFSYMFSKTGMERGNIGSSIQWLRANTGLPIADVLKENYHSFFVYTNSDARNVLKQITSVCRNTHAPEFYEKYTDPMMMATARTAKIGVELDKAMEKQYQSATKYEIENLTDLKEVAQKIKQADKNL